MVGLLCRNLLDHCGFLRPYDPNLVERFHATTPKLPTPAKGSGKASQAAQNLGCIYICGWGCHIGALIATNGTCICELRQVVPKVEGHQHVPFKAAPSTFACIMACLGLLCSLAVFRIIVFVSKFSYSHKPRKAVPAEAVPISPGSAMTPKAEPLILGCTSNGKILMLHVWSVEGHGFSVHMGSATWSQGVQRLLLLQSHLHPVQLQLRSLYALGMFRITLHVSFHANPFATVDLPRYPLGKSGYPMKAPPVDFQQYFGNLYVYVCVPCFAHSSMHPHFSLRHTSVPKPAMDVKPKEESAKASAGESK